MGYNVKGGWSFHGACRLRKAIRYTARAAAPRRSYPIALMVLHLVEGPDPESLDDDVDLLHAAGL